MCENQVLTSYLNMNEEFTKSIKKKTANEIKESMKWENDNLVRERIEKKEITEWLKEV